jgi:peptidoglycan/xylan/chitin deacetylase (PgdA/CDA1 family)
MSAAVTRGSPHRRMPGSSCSPGLPHRAARRVLRGIVGRLPLPVVRALATAELIVVYYHVVSDAPVPHVDHLYPYKNVSQFRADLDFLLSTYSPVTLRDVISRATAGGVLPRNALLLTFDDGFREIYEVVAPILRDKGFPAAFFLSTGFLDNLALCYQHKASLIADALARRDPTNRAMARMGEILEAIGLRRADPKRAILAVDYRRKEALDRIGEVLNLDFADYLRSSKPFMTSEQVRRLLDDGFEIGGHSVDHPYYSSLSLSDQLAQTATCMRALRRQFAIDYGAFAFPHNDDGVSQAFFDSLATTGLVDITMGTGGISMGPVRTHLQRVNVEHPRFTAQQAISWQYARGLLRRGHGVAQARAPALARGR